MGADPYPRIRSIHAHRIRAEKALGKPLPPGACVHHVDGTKSIESPLVICQDPAYHRLLHMRMRIVHAGGNPNTQRICTRCKQLTALEEMILQRNKLSGMCRMCMAVHCRQWYLKNSEKVCLKVRVWREANPEANKQRKKEWYAANREAIIERRRMRRVSA